MNNTLMIKAITAVKADHIWDKYDGNVKYRMNMLLFKAFIDHKQEVLLKQVHKDNLWKCECRGHIWDVAYEYRSAYNDGYDVPVRCQRCGMMDM